MPLSETIHQLATTVSPLSIKGVAQPDLQAHADDAVAAVRIQLAQTGAYVEQFFWGFDPHKKGVVTQTQFMQALGSGGVLLSSHQVQSREFDSPSDAGVQGGSAEATIDVHVGLFTTT